MPFFHWPNTKDQLYHLMQGNDDFIQVGSDTYDFFDEKMKTIYSFTFLISERFGIPSSGV